MKSIAQLINHSIGAKLHQLDALTHVIAHFFSIPTQHLDNRLWPVLKNQRLTLLTDDTHFATQARFQQQALRKHLSKHLNTNVRSVDIKVICLPLARIEQKTGNYTCSGDTASILHSIAQSIENKEIRTALQHLAITLSNPRK